MFSTTNTTDHLADIVELIAPQGCFALIDDPASLDIAPFKLRSVSVHWVFMFTRSMFCTADIVERGRLLSDVSRLVEAGTTHTTLTEQFGTIDAANLKRALAFTEVEARGKIPLGTLSGLRHAAASCGLGMESKAIFR